MEVMLTCVRYYTASMLGFRHIGEMMQKRGVLVDHFTVPRLALKILPVLAAFFRKRNRAVAWRWRRDETCVKVASTLRLRGSPSMFPSGVRSVCLGRRQSS